jgi:hypothetical protein
MHVHAENSLCSRSMYVRIDAIPAPMECPIIYNIQTISGKKSKQRISTLKEIWK